MDYDNSYVIRASNSTNIATVNQNDNATLTGQLYTQRITLNKLSNDDETPLKIINNNQSWELIAMESTLAGDGCFQSFKTQQSPTVWNTGVWNQNQYGIRHGGEGLWIYDNGNTTVSGNLDVGVDASSSEIDVHCNQQGYTGYTEVHCQSPWTSKLEFISTHPTPWSFIYLKGSIYFEFNSSNQTITHYKSLLNGSDDRLK